VWLRLRLLLPLLPTVRADREAENKKNLRLCLAQALPHLLMSPYLRWDPAAAAAAAAADGRTPGDEAAMMAAAAAAAAAADDAGDWKMKLTQNVPGVKAYYLSFKLVM
jgi:hypothetical protein